ncbi:MAG TPA: hypothetical protein VMV69_20215 [Pirellulales bacterium]|nr:hypothetical protein [Pirellulales bacterium]
MLAGGSAGVLPTRGHLVELMDAAHQTVTSFDVRVQIASVWHLTAVAEGEAYHAGRRFPARVTWRRWRPDETPTEEEWSYRQVLSSDGRRRGERYDSSSGAILHVAVWDNEVDKRLLYQSSRGTIGPPRPMFYTRLGHDYDYFQRVDALTYLHSFLRASPDATVEWGEDRGVLVLHFPSGTATGPAVSCRAWIDVNRGFRPSRIDRYRDAAPRLASRSEVLKWYECAVGVFVPLVIKHSEFQSDPAAALFGEPTHVVTVRVDRAKSRWNEPTDDGLFALTFPAGTTVADSVRGIRFVVGDGDTGKSIDRQLENSREKVGLARRPATSGAPVRLYVFVAVNLGVIGAVLFGLLLWRWRRNG